MNTRADRQTYRHTFTQTGGRWLAMLNLFEGRVECVGFQAHLLGFRWAVGRSLLNRFRESTTSVFVAL